MFYRHNMIIFGAVIAAQIGAVRAQVADVTTAASTDDVSKQSLPLPAATPNLLGLRASSEGYSPNQTFGSNLLPLTPTIGETRDYVCVDGCPPPYAGNLRGVMGRERPDYDPKGLPLGAFRLFPTLALETTYTDNVYYAQSDLLADTYFTISPRLDLQSQWSTDAVEAFIGLEDREFSNRTSENQTDWNLGGVARLDLLRGIDLYAKDTYEIQHEPRYSPDAVGSQKGPTLFSTENLNLRADFQEETAEHQHIGFGMQLGGSYQRYDYANTELIDLPSLSNADRDRSIYETFGKLEYSIAPDYSFYVQGSYQDRAYVVPVDRHGYDHHSTGYSANAGIKLELTNLIDVDAFVGYETEIFKSPLESVDGLDFGGQVHWYATELITLNLIATHSITDTSISGDSASNNQTFSAVADYELLRNLILHLNLEYDKNSFIGSQPFILSSRSAGFGASYLINHYLSAEAHYDFYKRTSNTPAPSRIYTNNVISVGLTGHL
jgi:hypothetical protein